MINWIKDIESPLKSYIKKAIRDSAEYKSNVIKARDKKTAQLWISIAQLSKDLQESKVRIEYLENVICELLETKKKQVKSKKRKTEINKLIKTLKKF